MKNESEPTGFEKLASETRGRWLYVLYYGTPLYVLVFTQFINPLWWIFLSLCCWGAIIPAIVQLTKGKSITVAASIGINGFLSAVLMILAILL